MAVNQGYGKTVTDGLVFAYDTNDYYNSFKGKPAANILTAMSYSYGEQNSDLFKTHYGFEDVYIPAIGKTTAHFCEIYNDYNGGSGNCCVSIFSYGGDIRTGVVGGAEYTYQIIYRTTTGYANGNYMYQYQYSDSGYITEYGLWSSSREEDLGDGWKHAWGTFTLNAATTRLYCYLFHYEYLTFNKVQVAGVMLTQGNTIYRPHQFFPYGNSISNTGGLLNLASSSTIDLSNMSFDTNGQMTFDGTNDYIDFAAGTMPNFGTNDFAIEVVFKMLNSTGYSHFYQVGGQYHFGLKMYNNDQRIYVYRDSSLSTYDAIPAIANFGVYNHLICQRNGDNIEMYVNGEYKGAKSGWDSINIDGITNAARIGNYAGEYSRGEQPITKIYNRALTASEVTQNYNHYKSRFNIS